MKSSNSGSVVAASIATTLGALLMARNARSEEQTPPEHPMMSDRYFVGAGVIYSESNVTANLNTGRVGLGTFIDFEDDMGLDEWNPVGVFMARMRLGKRWTIDGEYVSLDRSNEKQVSRTIDWGNLSIPVSAFARGHFNLEDARVSVSYAFFQRADKEIGAGLGAHVASVDAGLSTRNLGSERASTTAPLPVLTLYAHIALTDRWLFNIRVDRLSLDTGNIGGSVFSSATEFVYQPWRHFNIGLGYRDINVQITSTSEDWRGKAQVRLNGPFLFFGSTF